MRLWVRLATFSLSLTLLVGVLAHDVAGARMSLEMAASSSVEQQEDPCLACAEDAGDRTACDLDCTVQIQFMEAQSVTLPQTVVATVLARPADTVVRTRQPGFDPEPPRTTILS